ncbi:MAG TPA: helix-turn-helix transcriptional regulator [Vicinamibacterales bacterium]|nr:helix-turn-helix transcriptional regulator [Vicinamibacterales bacterium]
MINYIYGYHGPDSEERFMCLETSTTVDPLTPRERQIAAAAARGLTNKQIGAEFGISPETVKRHLASVYSKLELRGRVALAIHIVRTQPAA